MYILLKYTTLGPVVVVATTTVIMLAMNLFFNPMYSAKCLKIKPWVFYHTIIRHILSALAMMAVFNVIANAINPSRWLGLIGCAAVMSVVGVIIHFGFYWVDRKLFKA